MMQQPGTDNGGGDSSGRYSDEGEDGGAFASWSPHAPTLAPIPPSPPVVDDSEKVVEHVRPAPQALPSADVEQRRRALLVVQRRAREKEEADLREAIRASMDPSDRGRLGGFGREMSGETLSALMRDPAFVEGMDEGMRAAIDLQVRLDAEERALALAAGEGLSPGSLAPPIRIDAVSSEDSSAGRSAAASLVHRDGSFAARVVPAPLSPPRKAPGSNRRHNATKAAGKVGGRLSSIGSKILKPLRDMQLAEQLNAMNLDREEEELRRENHKREQREAEVRLEAELMQVKKEAEESCRQALEEHLAGFLSEHPDGTYDMWIEELHPENAHDGQLLEEMGKTIDHRFYVEDSDHRKLWNKNLTKEGGSRTYVPSRSMGKLVTDSGSSDVSNRADLLLDGEITNDAHVGIGRGQQDSTEVSPNDDLISFD